MSHIASDHDASVDEYRFSMEDFEGEIRKRHPTWRREQVRKVLSSFEEAKSVMSLQAIREIYSYLSTGKWISDVSCAGNHPAYKHLRDQKTHDFGQERLYYPYFFVIQAIYPNSEGVEKVAEELSQHWGIFFDWSEPWYPRLDDPVREHALIMGGPEDHENTLDSSSTSDAESSVSCIDVSRDPKREEAQPEPQNQPNSADSGNPILAAHTQLASIRDYVEQRITEEESEERLAAVRGYAEKVQHHVIQAKDLAKQADQVSKQADQVAKRADQVAKRADHHATVALEAIEALMERLDGDPKRPVSDRVNGRPSKRVRET
ncbi:hypothetical protein ACHAPJ_008672 [Fusarium lateritium]